MGFSLNAATIGLIEQWGVDRNIIGGATAKDQFFKLVSENGEWATGVLMSDRGELIDGLGDSMVVLTLMSRQLGSNIITLHAEAQDAPKPLPGADLSILAHLGLLGDNLAKGQDKAARLRIGILAGALVATALRHGLDINECLVLAYGEIKDRKGVMYNGIFIKSDDPRYEGAVAELAAKA